MSALEGDPSFLVRVGNEKMKLPLHAVRFLAEGPRTAATLLPNALDAPMFLREEVLDSVGLPCGYDIVVQDGFYVLLATLAVWYAVRGRYIGQRDE